MIQSNRSEPSQPVLTLAVWSEVVAFTKEICLRLVLIGTIIGLAFGVAFETTGRLPQGQNSASRTHAQN